MHPYFSTNDGEPTDNDQKEIVPKWEFSFLRSMVENAVVRGRVPFRPAIVGPYILNYSLS